MRPRVFPAEDARCYDLLAPPEDGFNEAAGIPRGRPVLAGAAAELRQASMRPRVFPAEDW